MQKEWKLKIIQKKTYEQEVVLEAHCLETIVDLINTINTLDGDVRFEVQSAPRE